MSVGRFLNHRVSIVRLTQTLDDADEPLLDDYGQPVRAPETVATGVPAGIQPKSAREVEAFHQAGVAIATHTVYLFPQDITTADQIVHDPDACPVQNDLPDGTYNISGVPDAAGAGHHIEVNVVYIGKAAYATPVGVGS